MKAIRPKAMAAFVAAEDSAAARPPPPPASRGMATKSGTTARSWCSGADKKETQKRRAAMESQTRASPCQREGRRERSENRGGGGRCTHTQKEAKEAAKRNEGGMRAGATTANTTWPNFNCKGGEDAAATVYLHSKETR